MGTGSLAESLSIDHMLSKWPDFRETIAI